MAYNLRRVHDLQTLLDYCIETLKWQIDISNFEDINDLTYHFDAIDLGIKEEEFVKISSLKQLRPIVENQPWGIFVVDFDSRKFEASALRKILSGLIPSRRNSEHATWDKKHLLFICFWGEIANRTLGFAHFEDSEVGLPQLKLQYCTLRIEDRIHLEDFENRIKYLSWPENFDEKFWIQTWSKAFTSGFRQIIRDSKTLAEHLAARAHEISNKILNILKVEDSAGKTHQLLSKFRIALIHDMSEKDFSDMYAQTIVYGLFSARCMSAYEDVFIPEYAVKRMPNTNPFLKSLLAECFSKTDTLSFDEFELDDIIDLLANTDIQKILDDFNRQTGGGKEDPVIYFYEGFLDYYEKEQKKRKGVYYTPYPIVDYMVKAVNGLIKDRFGRQEGLAEPDIIILDPATGTGTFLRKIIFQVYDEFRAANVGLGNDAFRLCWNEYVMSSLLPRINGFELMMAPYAVAHMKLAMALKDTGYDFNTSERVNVFLANTLENVDENSNLNAFADDPLAAEAVDANCFKESKNINVVIGNPPYNVESKNKGNWITQLMEEYKKEPGSSTRLKERNSKVINDDYVKFIRFAQNIVRTHSNAIIAYINPHSFIDNLTFRGMRWSLLKEFDEIYILDLHGNVNAKESFDGVDKDENVFDIQQGVSINIFVKLTNAQNEKRAKVFYSELTGSRDSKYMSLLTKNTVSIQWRIVEPQAPYYFFKPKDFSNSPKYEEGIKLSDLFPQYLGGVKTHHDAELVSIEAFNTEFDQLYDYRPFDIRHINYDRSKVSRDRYTIMKHFIGKENYGLIISRQVVTNNWSHIQIVRNMADNRLHTSRKGIPVECPMYLYDGSEKIPNVNMELVDSFVASIGMCFSLNNKISDNDFDMLDLYDYTYAILNSPTYRVTYLEFLSIDFPRIPIPRNREQFICFANLGSILRRLHLMDYNVPENLLPQFVGEGNNCVDRVDYRNNSVFINKTQKFFEIDDIAWNYFLGGYNPAQKWLKDRKGTKLSNIDIEHYKKMIAVFRISHKIMEEIDAAIDDFQVLG